MDFVSVILFLVIYYIRPHEWIHPLAILQPVKLVMAFALVAMFTRRGGVTLRDMFRTPHDWMMLFYFLWIVGSSGSVFETVKNSYSLYIFYLVAVQAFTSTERIQRFLNWWAIMILIVAGMAVMSEYGFDLTGSYDITHNIMKDRLVLNTSIFDNPNALGHSITPVVMMLYLPALLGTADVYENRGHPRDRVTALLSLPDGVEGVTFFPVLPPSWPG